MDFQWDCYKTQNDKEVCDCRTEKIRKEFLDVKCPLGDKLWEIEDEILAFNKDILKEKEDTHVEFLEKMFALLSYVPMGMSLHKSKKKSIENELGDGSAFKVVMQELKNFPEVLSETRKKQAKISLPNV